VADLVSHAAVGVLAKAGTKWRMVPVFVAGTMAPDVFSRGPAHALGWVHTEIVPLPPVLTYGWDPLHQPLGMVLLAYGLCLLTPAVTRSGVFLNLLGGMLLHLAVDMLQHHYGVGYLLGYPFTTWAFELGWIGSEDSVLAAPFLALLAAWAWRARSRAAAQDETA